MLIAWRFPIICSILLLTLAGTWWIDQPRPEPLVKGLETIDASIDGWTMIQRTALDPLVVEHLRATAYTNRDYRRGNDVLNLFIAYYAQQRPGENIHPPRHCLSGTGWELGERQFATIELHGQPVQINVISMQDGGDRRVVYYWYQSRQHIIASEYWGKLSLVYSALFTGRTAGSVVRVVVPDTPTAAPVGLRFAREVMLQVNRCLGL